MEQAWGSPWLVESLKSTVETSALRNRIERGRYSRLVSRRTDLYLQKAVAEPPSNLQQQICELLIKKSAGEMGAHGHEGA